MNKLNLKKDTIVEEPQKPALDDCCGGGSCYPCVWDEYRVKRKEWLKYLEERNLIDK